MIEYFSKLVAARREQGASAVEYGLMVAAIAAVIVGVVFAIGTVVNGAFTKTSDCLSKSGAAGCGVSAPADPE